MSSFHDDRRTAKRLFDNYSMFKNNPIAWTAWKMAFRFGMEHQQEKNKTNVIGELQLSELKNLLCNVSQLIQGWNATEAEWTEWDKEVQSKVHELQNKIDGLSVVNYH